jgi:hypothetical protein
MTLVLLYAGIAIGCPRNRHKAASADQQRAQACFEHHANA